LPATSSRPRKGSRHAGTYPLRLLGGNANLSVDGAGRSCLVFLFKDLAGVDIQFQGVLVEFQSHCRLAYARRRVKSAAIIVHCRDAQYELRFGAVVHDVSELVRADSAAFQSSDRVTDLVEEYAHLFLPVPRLQDREQRGLWGELYMIFRSFSPDLAVKAWTGPDRGLVDFSANQVEVEIKTTLGRHRHRVKHEQVARSPSITGDRALWSLQLIESGEGLSLLELVGSIRGRLKTRAEFESKLHAAGYADDSAYDTRYKVVSEWVIDHSNIPSLPRLPKQVSHLEYDLDLEGLQLMTPSHAISLWSRLIGQSHTNL
jgi:hypothetical protein